jgi:hypothetical protein
LDKKKSRTIAAACDEIQLSLPELLLAVDIAVNQQKQSIACGVQDALTCGLSNHGRNTAAFTSTKMDNGWHR